MKITEIIIIILLCLACDYIAANFDVSLGDKEDQIERLIRAIEEDHRR